MLTTAAEVISAFEHGLLSKDEARQILRVKKYLDAQPTAEEVGQPLSRAEASG